MAVEWGGDYVDPQSTNKQFTSSLVYSQGVIDIFLLTEWNAWCKYSEAGKLKNEGEEIS